MTLLMELVKDLVIGFDLAITVKPSKEYGYAIDLNCGTKGNGVLVEHDNGEIIGIGRYGDTHKISSLDDIFHFAGGTLCGQTGHDAQWTKLLIDHGYLEKIERVEYKLPRSPGLR